jgi:hypothetical protein
LMDPQGHAFSLNFAWASSYFKIICAERSSYWLKWIPIELLCDHIHLRFNVKDDMKFTKTII